MSMTETAAVDLITDLDEVVITRELTARPRRAPDYELEHRATSVLIKELAASPATVLQRLCDLLVELRVGQTAGVSLHEADDHRLRWVAVAGEWAPHLGGLMPFGGSPYGAVITRDEPVLFSQPHEHFPAANVHPLIREILLVPFRAGGKPVGTLWVMAHDETRHFDAEDLRMLTSLAHIASAAHQTMRTLEDIQEGQRELEASRNLLRATMDASTDMIQVFEAVRDVTGEIVDFRWVLNNHASESSYGKVEGESLLERNPGVVSEGIFGDFKRVTESGEPIQKERHYAHEQFDGWFYQSVVKLGDGVATTTKDITDWKRSQAEVMHLQEEVARAKLRESEDRYRTLFETMGQGYADCEMIRDSAGRAVDYRFIEINPAFERLTGISAAEVRGRTVREVIPGIEDFWIAAYDRIVREGRPERIEHEAASLGRWYEVHAYPLDGDRFAAVYEEITDRKRAEQTLRASEERQAFLLKLTDILQSMTAPKDMKTAAMHLLGKNLGVSRAQYHEIDDGGEHYDTDGVGFADGLPLLDGKYRMDQFGSFLGEAFKAGRPFLSCDFSTDPRPNAEERDAFAKYGVRAGAAAPLLRGGKLVAVLAVHDVRPHAWTDLEIELIRETGERVWVAVEKARTEAAIRESEERQAFLLELSDAMRPLTASLEIAKAATARLCERLGVNRVFFGELGGAVLKVEHDYTRGVPSIVGEHSMESFGPDFFRAYKPGAVIRVDDIEQDKRLTISARRAARSASRRLRRRRPV